MIEKFAAYPKIREMLLSIMKAFYDPIHLAIVNVLMHHHFLTDKDLADKLFMDHPSIRGCLNRLTNDKIIQQKMQASTDENDKTIKKDYYFINVKHALNSFMYRLKMASIKLEAELNRNICSGKYQCSDEKCAEFYEDIDVMSIFDQIRGEMLCRICGSVVNSIEDKEKRSSSRDEIKRFNNSIYHPFVKLYEECNKYKLPTEMIRPDLIDPTTMDSGMNILGASNGQGGLQDNPNQMDVILSSGSNANWSEACKDDRGENLPAWLNQLAASSSSSGAVINGGTSSQLSTGSANTEDLSSTSVNGAGVNMSLDGTAISDATNAASSDVDNTTQMMAPGRVPGAITSSSDSYRDFMELLMANEFVPENTLAYHQQAFAQNPPRVYVPCKLDRTIYIEGHPWDVADVDESCLMKMTNGEIELLCQVSHRLYQYYWDSYR